MSVSRIPRSPLAVTLAVWKALFLREAVNRMSRERGASLWLVVEPIVHILVVIMIYAVLRVRVVGGIDTNIWLMIGFTTFFMFRRTAQQTLHAVSSSQPLFTYRQVKPVDAVLVRAGVEGFLMLLVTIVLFSGAGLYGLDVMPADPLAVLQAIFGVWLVGLGFGLMASVISELVPELGTVIGMAIHPIFFFSGVIFPIAQTPQPYRDWFLLNPLVHGVEAGRQGFATYYHAIPELSVPYLYGCAVALIFFGLALHYRFATRLAAR